MTAIINYRSPATFNQTQCVICLETFKKNQKVVQLACKHIFDPDCFGDSFNKCPVCHQKIEGKDLTYSRSDLEGVIEDLFSAIITISPPLRAVAMDPSVKRRAVLILEDSLEEPAFNQVIRSWNRVQAIKEFTHILKLLGQESALDFERLVNRHSFFVIDTIKTHYLQKPVFRLREKFLEHFRAGFSKVIILVKNGWFIKNQKFENYLNAVKERVLSNHGLITLFESRKREFLRLNQTYLESLKPMERHFYLKEIDPSNLDLVMSLDIAKKHKDLPPPFPYHLVFGTTLAIGLIFYWISINPENRAP